VVHPDGDSRHYGYRFARVCFVLVDDCRLRALKNNTDRLFHRWGIVLRLRGSPMAVRELAAGCAERS